MGDSRILVSFASAGISQILNKTDKGICDLRGDVQNPGYRFHLLFVFVSSSGKTVFVFV